MTLAEEAREAIRDRPALYDALRAGVLNYSAAARRLDLGEEEAVATALRRFGEDLPDVSDSSRDVRVRMSRLDGGDPPVAVASAGVDAPEEDRTAVIASGDVDARALERVLGVLRTRDVAVEAAGVAADSLAVVVDRRSGADALRVVEDALEST